MKRLFVAIEIPGHIKDQLSALQAGVPGARWRPAENFHLTLRFIGEVDRHQERDIKASLAQVEVPAFDLKLEGTGQFGKDRPHTLWLGVAQNPALLHLASKVETAVQRAGLEPERRKYSPHVTLAYLKNPSVIDLNSYIADHAAFTSEPFSVNEFILYQSRMGKGGSHYIKNEEYPLRNFEYEAEEWESMSVS